MVHSTQLDKKTARQRYRPPKSNHFESQRWQTCVCSWHACPKLAGSPAIGQERRGKLGLQWCGFQPLDSASMRQFACTLTN
ncbi:hypothetical protein LSTR_LSTR016729 [Laodelphax striatellus]|uniref:Uncharacterized protein n=1 Tax=Laodelphax striatellus TaxID=195883 RepID=A0A482WNF8_LAOST|nr:hypothetical protein LSTR_LSTR016729 [Laodelphax striatellus]